MWILISLFLKCLLQYLRYYKALWISKESSTNYRMVEEMVLSGYSEDSFIADICEDISDDEGFLSSSQLKIIDNNIEKCIAELRKSFENLTSNMVLLDSLDQLKYKK